MSTKLCKKCNFEKPLEQFRKCRRNKDGHHAYCSECQDISSKQLYEKNKQKRIQQVIQWNKQHPDKLKQYKDNFNKKLN